MTHPAEATTEELSLAPYSTLVALIKQTVALKPTGRKRWRGCCPFHQDHRPSFYVDTVKGIYRCYGCGAQGDMQDWLMHLQAEALETLRKHGVARPQPSFLQAARPADDGQAERNRKKQIATKYWMETIRADGSAGETYLHERGLCLETPVPSALRFHPAFFDPQTGRTCPALVAVVRDSNRLFAGIHVTFLGKNASCTVQRMGNWFGHSVQLTPLYAPRLVLTVGLETALAMHEACAEETVWAALTVGNLKSPVPEQVQEIILCLEKEDRASPTARRLIADAISAHVQRGLLVRIMDAPLRATGENVRA